MFTLNNLIKQFRFYFDIRGVDTEELQNAPTGWRDMIVQYSRSKVYSGIIRAITGQLDFTGNAAYILRREYAKYRLMARINMSIDEDSRQPYNTYGNIYTGKLDFTKKVDKQNTFSVGAISADLTTNIDAYDSADFAIPLTDSINIELPGIALNEIATLIPSAPPDGNVHADYFPPIQIVNNTQNSIDASVQSVPYGQLRAPDFSTSTNWCFWCRFAGKLYVTGSLQLKIDVDHVASGSVELKLYLCNQNGTMVLPIYDESHPNGHYTANINLNTVIDIALNEKLFLYMQDVALETGDTGITIVGGQMNFSYQTITPPTMCQAISGSQLFGRLLQAMNVNQDSGPNLPVPFQSFLLSVTPSALGDLYFTSSDSIRAAQGSVFVAGNTLGPGIYKVVMGSVIYGGITYTLNQTFGFINSVSTFTGTGTVQKIQSIFVGNVYNIGDDLQAGGTYLVEGGAGGTITYNSITYAIGSFFKFILGFPSFTGSDDSMFVKQVAVDPQIVISFAKFFQAIKSVQGGDAAFGVENGIPYLETLANVYRAGIGQVDLGVVPKGWQSECATDTLYNTIKAGQKDEQYDALNGSQEVSSEQTYSSAQLTPSETLNLISEIRFDPFGIEIVRITQNDTAASRSDNDTWGIWINQNTLFAGDFEYKRPLGAEGLIVPILGVPDTYYNYNLSPKHNLLRGAKYLASIFYNMKGYQLTLTGYLKNVGMVCVGLDGVRVAEADPIDIAGLGTPYFIPEYYTFTVSGGLIDANSYASIAFTVNGTQMHGFVADYKVNFATKKPQPVKLLLSPNNDLSTAVR